MLEDIKARLEQTGLFGSVELAVEANPIDGSLEDNVLPAIRIYFGESGFTDSDSGGVTQRGTHEVIVQLLVSHKNVVETQRDVIRAVSGYQYGDSWTPMEVSRIKTSFIKGSCYSRLIMFETDEFIYLD